MIDTSLQPARGLGRGRFSRQQRVREAIGEARAALQITSGYSAPARRPILARARRWGLASTRAVAAWLRQLRRARPVAGFWGRHWSTAAVLALLDEVVAAM